MQKNWISLKIIPDAVDTAAEDFFTAQPEPTVTPTVTPAAPAEEPEQQPAPEPPLSFGIPLYDLTPTPEPAPQPVSAENAVAFRSEPDEDGWISITSDPVEEKDLNTLVAAAMEKPAVSEEQAANACVKNYGSPRQRWNESTIIRRNGSARNAEKMVTGHLLNPRYLQH